MLNQSENETLLKQILQELNNLKKQLQLESLIGEWIPLFLIPTAAHIVTDLIPLFLIKEYFDYRDTAISNLIKEKELEICEIGRRKFVRRSSIERMLNDHANNKHTT